MNSGPSNPKASISLGETPQVGEVRKEFEVVGILGVSQVVRRKPGPSMESEGQRELKTFGRASPFFLCPGSPDCSFPPRMICGWVIAEWGSSVW